MSHHRKPQTFSRYPMFWLAASFAAGLLGWQLLHIPLQIALANCIVLAIAAIVLKGRESAAAIVLASFAAAGMAAAGFDAGGVGGNRLSALYDTGVVKSGDAVEIEGILSGRPEPNVDGVFLNLAANRLRYRGADREVSGNVRLYLPVRTRPEPDANESAADNFTFEISDLKYGSRLRIACSLEREDEFLNPGVLAKRELLDRLGIDATGSIKSRLLVEKIADESVFIPLAWVYDRRGQLIDDFRANLTPRTAGVMIASLLGDKYFLDKDTADLFRDGGTFHILVISGLHITFIGGLLLFVLRWMTRNRWIQFVVVESCLWGFTLAVGADVPVVRAAVMFTVVLYSYVIYRPGTLLNSLGVCTLILLVWRPNDLFNPSFQLTFLSVAAIVAMAMPLLDKLRQTGVWTPTPNQPFPPNVAETLKRFCETLYWRPQAWAVESKRQIWTARLSKSPWFEGRLPDTVQHFFRYLAEGVLVSLIVQLWMLPLMVVYFHRISVVSIGLNLWVGFFIAIESFAAVTGAVAGHLSALLARPFFELAEVSNWLMLALPRLFADNGWASFRLPAYTGIGRVVYFLYLLPVVWLAFTIYRWDPFAINTPVAKRARRVLMSVAAASLIFTGVIVFHPFSAPRPDGRLHFDFLDVGQGDSALVTFPDGKTMLVDGGGRFSYAARAADSEPFEPDVRGIGEAVVSEYLWYRGYSRVDLLVATHADADHIQGLTDVAKNFAIGAAAVGRTPLRDPDYAAFESVVGDRGIPLYVIGRGDRFEFGDVTVDVLYPIPTDDPDAVSDNDHSVTLRIIFGERAFLLTGDIERRAEAEIVASGDELTVDLIKVAHHGSHTSSTRPFVDATAAKFAVISVGRTSPFGHPHEDVVERWVAAGAKVMTTGERGTVSVSTDGRDLEISTFQP